MTINLVKGQKIDLTKGRSDLTKLLVGLGWDPAEEKSRGLFGFKKSTPNIDCDASALMLSEDDKLLRKENLVCFYNLTSACGSVKHSGDNLTGEGAGDDEQISIDLSKVPADVHKILVVVNIYQAEQRRQDFGMIASAYIRVANEQTGEELARYNLTDNYAGMTALVTGEIYRSGSEWKFNAIGQGKHAAHVDILAREYV
ncbi:TerD family protein [Paenibacillus hunanensis]|uniref:Stress response protein SCP2 n=1 Tax=Paenibacillus hunanensis TaxID=539262 RepID=A0ABU1IUC6_9BACL|nr:TerD family protein [Paenibacillus hunanensis]MCL9661685.1 TerD family protein [Paenibacillus hunanensis]MDR6242779.1 stress response protein SCP2 [Paenibacillus hunanensis]WPP41860.1 TerD family protein [Paenibacillus hunanensis]GGJ02612.1 stress protein [Paenibacillus hunanensis]